MPQPEPSSPEPQTISTQTIYTGKVFDIRVDEIDEGGVEYKREIVVHKGSAVVMPVFPDGTIALVRQYRHAAGEYLLEIPAGTLEIGEDPLAGAVRELEEEIGVTAEKIEKLCEFYVSPGFLTEKMHLYVASDLTEVGQKLETDEILTVERHTVPALLKMIQTNQIQDAKTIIAVLICQNRELH
jgi:ADP-ribose pyrophosphatase